MRITSCIRVSALLRIKAEEAKACTMMKNYLFFKEAPSHFGSHDNTSVFRLDRFLCRTNSSDYSKTSAFLIALLSKEEWKIFFKNGTINSHSSI